MPDYDFICTHLISKEQPDGTFNYTTRLARCHAFYEEYDHPVLGCRVYKQVGPVEVIEFLDRKPEVVPIAVDEPHRQNVYVMSESIAA